ncbi:hypothetical protein [Deinococcus aestuarii]|uniref:hypothetical protein n=1 Tax=Deinococcus aestuarii TaxID=2774531 RepID=UPI001C0BF97D|nr:hypothetical protein [Deinococcus aestuarii]
MRAVPLQGTCAHCEKPGTLYYRRGEYSDYFCTEHRAGYALTCAAGDDLKTLLTEACRAWLEQWGHLEYTQIHALDEVSSLAEDVMQAALDERKETGGTA